MKKTIIISLELVQCEKDFELPALIPLRDLYPRLLKVLSMNYPREYANSTGIIFQSEDGMLSNLDATLSDYGIRTGSRLTIVRKG